MLTKYGPILPFSSEGLTVPVKFKYEFLATLLKKFGDIVKMLNMQKLKHTASTIRFDPFPKLASAKQNVEIVARNFTSCELFL